MTDQTLSGANNTDEKHKPALQIDSNGSVISSASSSPAPKMSNPRFEVIPHPDTVTHRNLILCFDGTGDQFDADNSNIVELTSMLKKDDCDRQLVYYQAGIGTYTIPQIATPGASQFRKKMDMALGAHLDAHIMGGYEFLMQNFRERDRIFIFGFSRGAYTARALAGMIQKVGLLPPCNHQQVPFAYRMYTLDTDDGWRQSNQFKKAFSTDVDIEFVGVWDTVASVGIFPRRLPLTKSNNHIRHFRHAVSLDERRARFKVNLWNRPSEQEQKKGVEKGTMPRAFRMPSFESLGGDKVGKNRKELEREYAVSDTPTDVEEVWFVGAHCDVGGGSVPNATRHNLARIPLRWMIRQCFILKTGILFYKDRFERVGLNPDTLYPIVEPRPPPIHYTPGCFDHKCELPINFAKDYRKTIKAEDSVIFKSEEEEDLLDALTPIYDQLKMVKGWWLLEFLPYKHLYQNSNDTWSTSRSINRGYPRMIPGQSAKPGIKVHRTVKIRENAVEFFKDKNYKPAAIVNPEPQWVS